MSRMEAQPFIDPKEIKLKYPGLVSSVARASYAISGLFNNFAEIDIEKDIPPLLLYNSEGLKAHVDTIRRDLPAENNKPNAPAFYMPIENLIYARDSEFKRILSQGNKGAERVSMTMAALYTKAFSRVPTHDGLRMGFWHIPCEPKQHDFSPGMIYEIPYKEDQDTRRPVLLSPEDEILTRNTSKLLVHSIMEGLLLEKKHYPYIILDTVTRPNHIIEKNESIWETVAASLLYGDKQVLRDAVESDAIFRKLYSPSLIIKSSTKLRPSSEADFIQY